MKRSLITPSLAVVAAASCWPLSAAAFDYTYLEGGFVDVDNDFLDDSGFRFAGSGEIAPSVALIGEYADTGDFEQLSAGAVYHQAIERNVDLFFGGTVELVDLPHDDDTGFGLRAGLRWRPNPRQPLELTPEVRHLDVFDESFTSLRLGALYRLAPALDLQGALQAGDDDRFELGLRYNF